MTKFCERVEAGALLVDAAKHAGVARQTLWEWTRTDETLADMYTRARLASADLLADEALAVARASNAATYQQDRVRIDTLKWTAAKRRPRVYGDRLDLTSDGQRLVSGVIVLPSEDAAPQPVSASTVTARMLPPSTHPGGRDVDATHDDAPPRSGDTGRGEGGDGTGSAV